MRLLAPILAALALAACNIESDPAPPGNDVNIVTEDCAEQGNEVCK